MTPLIIATTLIVAVLVTGVAAGPVIRRAAPALMRVPRLTVLLLGGVLTVWVMGLAAFGPTLAWALGTPAGLLPGASGEVCQRCLAAANPLPADLTLVDEIPAVILLALPVVLAATMFVAWLRYRRQQHQQKQMLASALGAGARKAQIAGHTVTIIPHDQPTAFAMADRRWGIVVSTALLRILNDEEMTAVIAHEAAHVRQRHHLVTGLLHGAFAPLRWIPLVGALHGAIPQYLEMAADNAARQASSTDVMASALLKLGEGGGPAEARLASGGVALHAAGIDRVRHLIAPPDPSRSVAPIVAMGVATLLVSMSTVFVLHPYWQAIVDGCLI